MLYAKKANRSVVIEDKDAKYYLNHGYDIYTKTKTGTKLKQKSVTGPEKALLDKIAVLEAELAVLRPIKAELDALKAKAKRQKAEA